MAKTTKTTLPIIRPLLTVTTVTNTDLLPRLTKVYDGMLNNTAYPSPTIDMPGYKAAIDAYSAAVTAALDGGKTAITALSKARSNVVVMYRSLGHYVETACKGDENTFVSSGFTAVPKPQKTPAQPVSVPTISVSQGANSGTASGTISKVAQAKTYDIRFAPALPAGAAAGTNVSWTLVSVAGVKPPTVINNLTPGTTYQFQARAFGKLGFSDWSDPVNLMVT
jgi:hypothetical protein